ncbi:MAG: hypothetical protein ABIR03_13380 [Ginsengibacter sp.]
MNINLHNYEEFFLLYADNELPEREKYEVEVFVKQHTELEEEFNMIKLTISSPDEKVRLADKSFLMKSKPLSFINDKNYEEVFVLYHDDELSEEQKNETERFLSAHPELKVEFELIGKSKLIPEPFVVFPEKKMLYRKEKPGRVIPFIFWKSIAAAVFIGIGLWLAVSYFSAGENGRSVLVQENKIKSQEPNRPDAVAGKIEGKENRAISSVKEKIVEKQSDDNNTEEQNEHKIIQEKKRNPGIIVKSDGENKKLPEKKVLETRPDHISEIIAANGLVNKAPDLENINSALTKNEMVPHVDRIEVVTQPDQYAQTASLHNNVDVADINANNDNYIFYNVPADEFKKSKVGGFLKKVKRIVERSNPITRLLSGEEKQVASK